MDARLTSRFALFLLLGITLLSGCGGSEGWGDHTQGLPFVMGYEAGLKEAAAKNKPAMMFVTTTWCGWCKKLAEDNFTDAEVKKLLDNFVLVIVDGDVEKSAASKLGAEGYPHIVFVTSKGDTLVESSGYVPVEAFKPIVEKALEKSREGKS